jgi:hypothetical protein
LRSVGEFVKATTCKETINERWVNKHAIYVNTFVVKLNALLYKATGTPHLALGNGLVMLKGATKVSVDDKAAVYIGRPGFLCQSNTRKTYASIVVDSDIGKASAGDHNIHLASVRLFMTMFITTPIVSHDSWQSGKVACSLKDCAAQRPSPMQPSLEFIKQCCKQVQHDDQILWANPF